MKHIFSVFLCCVLLSGCVRNQSATLHEDGDKIAQNGDCGILHNLIDSLLSVYPQAMQNPIQRSDFIEAVEKSVERFSAEDVNLILKQTPFELYDIQNSPNPTDGKYLTAFEFTDAYITAGDQSEDGYATIGEPYDIQIYCFASLDKDIASKLEDHKDYRLSGEAKIIDKPTWDDKKIMLGIEVKNATVTKIQYN